MISQDFSLKLFDQLGKNHVLDKGYAKNGDHFKSLKSKNP